MNYTISQVWTHVLSLFGRKSLNTAAQRDAQTYRDDYERTERVNFTAIFAESLANKAVSDSTMVVRDGAGNSSRKAEWLEDGLNKVWNKNKPLLSQALGKGGKVLVPRVWDGKALVDAIDQSRMAITAMRGDEITGATLLADIGHMLLDPEIPEDAIFDTIGMIEADMDIKADSYAKIIKSMDGDAAQIDEEIKRLQGRKNSISKRKAWMQQQ